MPSSGEAGPRGPRAALGLLVVGSGLAGLTWELLWQHHAALALGISAAGAAVTLAAVMGGMALGAATMGAALRRWPHLDALQVFAGLELTVGLAGTTLAVGFSALGALDTIVWRGAPGAALPASWLGIALLLGPAALAMGATVPVFERLAGRIGSSVGRLYGLNTAGAAAGVLIAAFVALPRLGVELTAAVASSTNVAVALGAWLLAGRVPRVAVAAQADRVAADADAASLSFGVAGAVAALTGFCTFALEIAWFRSLRAAFQSTADSFALVLAAVLIALAIGARVAARVPARRGALNVALALAATLVLLATPVIERLDQWVPDATSWFGLLEVRAAWALGVLGPPMLALGVALPWLLEQQHDPRRVGRLYALNTLGAMAGSLSAAWVWLPAFGFARTAWLAGGLLGVMAVVLARGARHRALVAAPLCVAALVAVALQRDVGRMRAFGPGLGAHTVLASQDGPDVTVAVVEDAHGERDLIIDGFQTAGEEAEGHYMAWMGRLPMLLHPDPRDALVICFGTGQTANAVRQEGVERLDVVDVSAEVLSMHAWFRSNQGVLDDPRVRAHVMDGRAWLRRTERRYDVITLEPMAPHFAGTNALYSKEFYALAAARLRPGGVVAQWVPFHILSPEDAVGIAAAFVASFPDAGLWVDPRDRTGILVGGIGPIDWGWPGLDRARPGRNESPATVRGALALGPAGTLHYAALGDAVTDDNQELAYGPGRRGIWRLGSTEAAHVANLALIESVAAEARDAGLHGGAGSPPTSGGAPTLETGPDDRDP